jgi:hypothetical protein
MSLTLFSCETTTAAIFGIRSTPGARLIPNEGADHVSVVGAQGVGGVGSDAQHTSSPGGLFALVSASAI